MKRIVIVVAIVLLAACGGGNTAPDLCDTMPTPECMVQCDPAPGSVNTCPAGYHCQPDGLCGRQCTPGGGECGDGAECTDDGRCIPEGSCNGLECQQVDCPSGGTTSISGTVYAPEGTIPLSGITVYVPNGAVPPFPNALACDRCNEVLSDPLVEATTDTSGNFTLIDMPVGANIPVVIQVGRWRRQLVIPNVAQCVDTPLPAADTRLPRNKSEGDIPRMALTTGGADSLECLLRKIGLDDAEITTPSGSGRVHLYAGNGTNMMSGGGSIPNADTLWSDVPSLSNYDITFLSCEGSQNESGFPGYSKPQTSLAALKSYADMGGRVFASHWHNIWVERSPPWMSPPPINRVSNGDLNPGGTTTAIIDQSYTRGADLAQWLVVVAASTVLGQIDLVEAKHTVSGIFADGQRWIWVPDAQTPDSGDSIQYMSYTTPTEAPRDQRCGRVVFSDIHVSAGDNSQPGLSFPDDGCTTPVNQLTPQEKVLLFMIFDIASCIPDIIE
jgi:hypothetical protein